LVAAFVLVALVTAIMGVWWTAISSALLAVAQLASIDYERRKAVGRNSQADPSS
jgi:hypothetical protein